MKNSVLNFLKRGAISAAFAPIILGIIYECLQMNDVVTSVSVDTLFWAILSSEFMAFIAGGFSVVYEIERLSLLSASLIHVSVLYADYLLFYLFNGWLETNISGVLGFTVLFLLIYVIIWLIIYLSIRKKIKKLNKKLGLQT